MKCSKCSNEYYADTCPFCSNEQPTVLVVTDKTNERKNKKMIVIIAIVAVILAAAILIAVFVSKGKKDQTDTSAVITEEAGDFISGSEEADTTPLTADDDVTVSFDGINDTYADALFEHTTMAATTVAVKPEATTSIPSTAAQQTTKPAKPSVSTTKYLETTTTMTNNPTSGSSTVTAKLTAFFSGKYYMDGTMISGGEKTPLEMAINGKDFHVYSEMDGQDIAIMNINGQIYLMNPDTKKYTELNSSIKNMMGISEESFSFGFNNIKFDASKPSSVTECTHNGKAAVCYTYKDASNHIDFIAVGNDIVQMILYNSDGTADTVVELDEFSAEYPADMLTFKGYSKTNVISFISSLM